MVAIRKIYMLVLDESKNREIMETRSPLGEAINTPELYTMISEDRFRDAWRFLDDAMKGHPAPENDPSYVPFNETLAFCLLKDGSILQADAVFDRVRGVVHKNDYSETAKMLDVALRTEFMKVRYFAQPLSDHSGKNSQSPRSHLHRSQNRGGRQQTRQERPTTFEPGHDLDLTK